MNFPSLVSLHILFWKCISFVVFNFSGSIFSSPILKFCSGYLLFIRSCRDLNGLPPSKPNSWYGGIHSSPSMYYDWINELQYPDVLVFSLINSCQVYWETYIAPSIDPIWTKISPYVLPVYNDLRKAARMWWRALKSGDINRIKKGT